MSPELNAVLLKDGPNSDRVGTDFLLENIKIDAQKPFEVDMSIGGGFVLKIE